MAYYFADVIDELFCLELSAIKDMARSQGLKEVEVVKAKRVTGQGFFYCIEHGFCGEVGEGCGTLCKEYEPRNRKNGRCINSGYCYEHTDEKRTIKL